MLLSSLKLTLFAAALSAVGATADSPSNSFHESLTLHPLPDGKLSVLFEFTTVFTDPTSSSSIPQSHHTLTPPSLLLPLQANDISELTISFASGQWDQRRSSESGPLHYSTGGGGGEVHGWVRDSEGGDGRSTEERWGAVTYALGGLFCAGLGPKEPGENVKTFGGIYPPRRGSSANLTHYLLSHPHHHLCTENLTPFLSLLPSKGLSGLSALLAQPGIIFSWGFQSEGIHVLMPSPEYPEGKWTGWWEGVVDMIPPGAGVKHVKREGGLEKLFGRKVLSGCSEAASSVVRVVMPEEEGMVLEPEDRARRGEKWLDGRRMEVVEWDLLEEGMVGKDIKFWWDGEAKFEYPRTFAPPPIAIKRTIVDPQASDGKFQIRISNNGDIAREAIYSEIWPWWVKGWVSELTVGVEGSGPQPDLLKSLSYHPSTPPTISTTSIHLSLSIPARSTLIITIPFTKLTLKYNDHRPDAERGIEIPSGVLTLLDLLGESAQPDDAGAEANNVNPRRSSRARIYSNRLLLDVPTPDFSMPYNVIIMSSTVMAVFFGLMQGALTRRWGWVEVPGAGKGGEVDGEERDGKVHTE
ncbi:hypothetical protein IAT38_003952 [Cryptococcus sp. DSM 104549]